MTYAAAPAAKQTVASWGKRRGTRTKAAQLAMMSARQAASFAAHASAVAHFLALGSLAPSARSIFAMTWLFGMALPASYSLITCGCMLS